ncbi:hypothetical protein V3331_13310 [Gaopeijia maritima]|uniref:hypothetical protein n=1 Tax=Gaopeijia maritima TaxID=3119007 RepID=UPI003246D751
MDYQKLYDDEMAGRGHARSAASTPVSLVTIFSGIIVIYAREFVVVDLWAAVWFFTALAFAAALLLKAVYELVRSLHGYEYERIPTPEELRAYEIELRRYYAETSEDPGLADAELREWMNDRYAEAAERNARNNLEKSGRLFLCTKAIIYCLVGLALALPPFLTSYWRTPTPIDMVEIHELREILTEFADVRRAQDPEDAAGPIRAPGVSAPEADTTEERGVQGRQRDP